MTVVKSLPMCEAALAYARRGWQVFPLHTATAGQCSCSNPNCENIGKHPHTKRGLLEATTNTEQIHGWWHQWPDANIGVRTGQESGIFVVDVDVKKADGLHAWTELLDMNGPVETLTAITGSGGQHWVFTLPPNTSIRNGTNKLGPGIDIRGDGGYIVVWPSVHESGNTYEWEHTVPPSSPPQWLVTLCETANRQAAISKAEFDPWVTEALANGATEGTRNHTAIRLAGYFTSKGLPRDVVLELLQPFAEKCDPPFQIPELLQVVDSSQRYQIQIADAKVSKAPEIEERAGILYYSWTDVGLTAEVDQLHRNKQGVHCELTIHANHSEPPRVVHGPVAYNMVSTSGRSNLIKYLKDRWELDWMQILEDLSRLSVAYLRTGNPVVDLREYAHRPTSQYALYPFVLEDQPVIFFGQGGDGKSLMALAAMLSLEYGIALLPGTTATPGHKGLYVDFEDQPADQGMRSHQMLQGLGHIADDMARYYLKCEGPLHEQAGNIKRHMTDHGITFLVLDSAGYACGGDGPEKAEAALTYFRALRSLNVPSITIAHNTKDQKYHMPFGSNYWHNSARATWEVVKQQESDGAQLHVGMFNQKANSSEKHRPRGFDLTFSPEAITIESTNVQQVPELAERTTILEQIKGSLEGGALTVKDLSEGTGIKENTIQVTLKRHTRIFTKVGTNLGAVKWGLLHEI